MLEGDLSERAICLRGRFVLEGESSVCRPVSMSLGGQGSYVEVFFIGALNTLQG